MRYDLLEPDKNNVEQSVQLLADTVSELLAKSWLNIGQRTYGHNFNLHINSFIHTWLQGVTKIFVAYDDTDKPVGFAIGALFRPLQFECSVLQIECYLAETPEVDKGLTDYITNALRFFSVDEIWFIRPPHLEALAFPGWHEKEVLEFHRLEK